MKIKIDQSLMPKQHGRPTENDPDCSIGVALRLLRIGAGMTQNEVATVIGMERTSVTNMERGNQIVMLHKINQLAEYLGAEVEITFRPVTPNEQGQGPARRSD